MAYTRNPQWKDHPDTSTPIDAAKLENIEEGIVAAADAADAAVSALDGKSDVGHSHTASAITSGTMPPERLGGGAPASDTFLRGDSTWATPPTPSVADATTGSKGVVQLAGDLGGTATAPTVNKIKGVDVANSPTAGQILVASSSSSSSWGAQPTGAIPSQTGHAGEFLSTNGSSPIWSTSPTRDMIDVASEYGTTAAAVNSAITQANTNYVANVGRTIVYLRAGIWDLSAVLVAKNGVTVRGAGRGQTIVRPTGTNPAMQFITGSDAARLTNFTLEHLTIDGVNQSGVYSYQVKGLYFMYVSGCIFRHLDIRNTYASGLGLDYPSDHTVIDDVHFNNCGRGMGGTIEGGNGLGILTGARDVEDCVISNCTAKSCANVGFLVERKQTFKGMGYRVSDCIADSCGRAGFSEAGSLGAIFDGCIALNTTEHGFLIGVGDDPAGGPYRASGGGMVSNCVSMYNGGDGIRYDGTSGVSSFTHFTITNNSVRGNSGNGINAYAVTDHIIGLSISGNRCANNGNAAGEAGIALSSGGTGTFKELTLRDNDCYANTNSGILVSATVTGGVIGNNRALVDATQTVGISETGTITSVQRLVSQEIHKATTAPSDTTLVWVDTSGI